ncbi:hypothetical protein [Lacticaseibacillus daqingensis]|uniref:hypothetical protein n=1 Tax=Lacticaseibacillus daqingensis TaxID=2486014 RepID=UPI001CDB88C4|nr:hypothetical protein [Lacticaseibacillus daqingensis]
MRALVPFPADFRLVTQTQERRNDQLVTIFRFQADGVYQYNGPRIIGVFYRERLLSLKNLTHVPQAAHLSQTQARTQATQVMTTVDAAYARGLNFMRIESQRRDFITAAGQSVAFPVYWVKFGHQNGSYNWVTLGLDGTLVEMECESRWDYFGGRRATEMWDNDDWVLARNGAGPQLDPPNARA